MKLLFGKLLLFVLLLFSADLITGIIIGGFHLKSNNVNLKNANYGFLNYENNDIVFFGASEVSHSFISNKVTEDSGLSSYNLASDGCGIYYQYPLLETILEKHRPKVVLISAHQLTHAGTDYLSRLYPYYKNNEHVKKVVDDLHPREWIKLAFQGYVYNSQFIRIFDGRNDNAKGYVPLTPRTDIIEKQNLFVLPEGKVYDIADDSRIYFAKFLEKAVSSGATVYVYVPPVLEKINDSYLNTVKAITKNAGAKIMDFSTDYSLLDRKELFNDRIHLNHDGAVILTDKFLEILKQDNVF